MSCKTCPHLRLVFSVSCRNASRPSLSHARNTTFRAGPLQIMGIIQWNCADAGRSCSSRIIGVWGRRAFAADSANGRNGNARACAPGATPPLAQPEAYCRTFVVVPGGDYHTKCGTRQKSPCSLCAECAGCLRTSRAEGNGRSAAGSA